MFIDSSMTVLAFQITNGLAVVAVFFYAYKRLLVPEFKQYIVAEQQQHADFIQQKKELEQQHYLLQERGKEQQKEGATLVEKIGIWRTSIEKNQAMRMREKKKYIQMMEQRAVLYQQQRLRERYIKEVVPKALHQAGVTLEKQFAQKDAGEKYVQTILDTLKDVA